MDYVYRYWRTANYNDEVRRMVDACEDEIFFDGWREVVTEMGAQEHARLWVEASVDLGKDLLTASNEDKDFDEFLSELREDLFEMACEEIRERLAQASLEDVITASEAARRFNVSREGVHKACQRGRVVARKSDGGIWLISASSARQYKYWNRRPVYTTVGFCDKVVNEV